ncbi:MAG TPA: hypothetical protein VIJ78_00755 [Pseudolabrys sp.]
MHHPNFNKTSFKPGRKKTGGRKAGVPNKMSNTMAEALFLAAAANGSDGAGKDGMTGYLMMIALTQPRTMGALLGRLLIVQEKENRRAGHPF